MNYMLFADQSLDGFVTAMMLHYKALYDGYSKIRMLPYHRDNPLPKLTHTDRLMFVSVSQKPSVIEELVYLKGVKVIVLDHHALLNEELNYSFLDWQNIPYFFVQDIAETDLFCNLNSGKDPSKVGSRYYFANNEIPGKLDSMKRSSCGIAMDLFRQNDPAFVKFLNTFLRKELDILVELTQTHELWLHRNDEKSEAYLLNQWFKRWYLQKKPLFDRMVESPDESNDIMVNLKADFLSSTMEERIQSGRNLVIQTKNRIESLVTSSKTTKVFLEPYVDRSLAVCYIHGEDIDELSPGLIGNDIVKNHGWDIAILDGGIERGIRKHYLYSNIDGADVNLYSLAERLVQDGLISWKTGRPNAIVIYSPSDNDDFIQFTKK